MFVKFDGFLDWSLCAGKKELEVWLVGKDS